MNLKDSSERATTPPTTSLRRSRSTIRPRRIPHLTLLLPLGSILVALVLANPIAAVSTALYGTGARAQSESAMFKGNPAWFNLNSASLEKRGSFHFEMSVGANIPARPSLLGFGTIDWMFGISTNNSAAPAGWPFAKNTSYSGPNLVATYFPAEFTIQVWWDGTQFAAGVANRTPLLTGGKVAITPVAYSIVKNHIRISVPPGLLGNAANFSFYALAEVHRQPDVSINPLTHHISALAVKNQPWGWADFWSSAAPLAPNCSAYINGWFCAANWSQANNGTSAVTIAGSPNWWDPVSGKVSGDHTVLFQMNLAGTIPRHPSLSGEKALWWLFAVDTNRSTNPSGWPVTVPDEPEYWVFLAYVGNHFAAAVVNSTPSLGGGNSTITPVRYWTIGAALQIAVPRALLGNATSAGIVGVTVGWWPANLVIHSATNITLLAATANYNPENWLFPQDGSHCAYYGAADGDCYAMWHS